MTSPVSVLYLGARNSTVTSLSFFLDHAVRGHRFTLRMQGTPDAKFMNKIIFVALLEPQWAPIYTCRGGPWGSPGGFWRCSNPLWWVFCPHGIFNGGLRRRSPQDVSPPPTLVVLGSVSASSAGRPRASLRLQRRSYWEASPPPAPAKGASPGRPTLEAETLPWTTGAGGDTPCWIATF